MAGAEYRRRGAGTGAGIWAVLAGGFTTMVVNLALLLAGAAIAGTSTLLLLTCAVGQAAGRLVPLPGGLGGMEGGVLGALALTGTPARRRGRRGHCLPGGRVLGPRRPRYHRSGCPHPSPPGRPGA